MPMHFLFRPLPRVTGIPPWLLRPMRVSTSSELYPDARLFFCFFECIGIQFFNLETLVSDLRNAMPRQRSLTSRAHTYDLRDAMPRQRSLYTYPPRP